MTQRVMDIMAGLVLSLLLAGCSSTPGAVPPAAVAERTMETADAATQACAKPTTWTTIWHVTRVSPPEDLESTWFESLDLPKGTAALRVTGAVGPHAAASWSMGLRNEDGAEVWTYASPPQLTGPGGTQNMPRGEVAPTRSDAHHVYSWEATGVVAYSDVQIEAGTCKR